MILCRHLIIITANAHHSIDKQPNVYIYIWLEPNSPPSRARPSPPVRPPSVRPATLTDVTDVFPFLATRRPHLARLCVSDVRMPLIWKGEDHFRNRGDFRRFAVFCLVRVGTDIFDTTLVNPVDRSMTDVCFDDVFVL